MHVYLSEAVGGIAVKPSQARSASLQAAWNTGLGGLVHEHRVPRLTQHSQGEQHISKFEVRVALHVLRLVGS